MRGADGLIVDKISKETSLMLSIPT
jgi:hypothetical protein